MSNVAEAITIERPQRAPLGIVLNAGQQQALDEILAAIAPGAFYLLTGDAGTGKSTLLMTVVAVLLQRCMSCVLCAPTHKAVAVLERKLRVTGIRGVPCLTIHSLLSLTAKTQGDRLSFDRKKYAGPVLQDVVFIDECSMISAEMLTLIRRHLPNCFVLFVGDPAQLPPIGEVTSQTFNTPDRSHLSSIVRQAEGNPILAAAHVIRCSQGGPIDWSWCKLAMSKPYGVYLPGRGADAWMQKGFTSAEFASDNDSFRYLCWTNDRVAEVNHQVQAWIYGDDLPTPFMPSERVLIRAPIIHDKIPIFATNEEASVLSIAADVYRHTFQAIGGISRWVANVSSWCLTLRRDDGTEHAVHIVDDEGAYNTTLARLADEAREHRKRWNDYHAFKTALGQMQSVYALTVHTSQGSTFKNCFVDVPDIRRRAETNVLEAQQLFYVAVTRPTHAVVLVGLPRSSDAAVVR